MTPFKSLSDKLNFNFGPWSGNFVTFFKAVAEAGADAADEIEAEELLRAGVPMPASVCADDGVGRQQSARPSMREESWVFCPPA